MEKSIVIKASSVDLAIEKALAELGVSRDQTEIEIISKGGMLKHAEVKVSIKESEADVALGFVNETLEKMGLVARGAVKESTEGPVIEISGEDSGAVIGYRGEVLDAIQLLARTHLNQVKPSAEKLVVDCENYREKRRETLIALAKRLAEKAYRTRRQVKLEPMNPYERRIIHSALADSDIAQTTSMGEEPTRYVVIIPKGVQLRDDRNRRNADRRGRGMVRGDYRRNNRYRDNREDGDLQKFTFSEDEIPDGTVYRGYYTDNFVRQEQKSSGPPKFKSFGGKKT